MTYSANADLPQSVRTSMPDEAVQSLFRAALNAELRTRQTGMVAYLKAYRTLENLGVPHDGDTWARIGKQDIVSLDVPLLIRLLEVAREDIQDDEPLHVLAERLVDLSNGVPLTMESYAQIIAAIGGPAPEKAASGQPAKAASVAKRISGNSDIGLNAKGQKLAASLGQRLALRGGLDILHSSPLKRARQTAKAIVEAAPAGNIQLAKPAPEMQPWHLGDIEGKQSADVKNLLAHYIENPDEVPPGKGRDGEPSESFNAGKKRQLDYAAEVYKDFEEAPTLKIGMVMHSRGMELLQAWVDAGCPEDQELELEDLIHPDDPEHADVLRWHGDKVKELDLEDDDPLKPGVYLIMHSLTDDDTDEGNPDLEKRYTPPVEVLGAAKTALEAGNVVEGITEALASGAGLNEQQVRKVDEYFRGQPTDATAPAWGGRHAEKWALRVLRKIQTDAAVAAPRPAPDQPFELRASIVKLDQSQHLVFGWFSIVEVDGRPLTDTQGDRITADTIEQSAYKFVLEARTGGAMHEETGAGEVRGVGRLVESVVFTREKQAAMVQSLKSQGIDAVLDLRCVAWWGGMKIDDEATWQRVTTGELRAWSIGGRGKREKVA